MDVENEFNDIQVSALLRNLLNSDKDFSFPPKSDSQEYLSNYHTQKKRL